MDACSIMPVMPHDALEEATPRFSQYVGFFVSKAKADPQPFPMVEVLMTGLTAPFSTPGVLITESMLKSGDVPFIQDPNYHLQIDEQEYVILLGHHAAYKARGQSFYECTWLDMDSISAKEQMPEAARYLSYECIELYLYFRNSENGRLQ